MKSRTCESFMFYVFHHSHNVVWSLKHDNYDVINTDLPTWHEGNNMHGAKSGMHCILNAYLYSNGTRNDGSSQGSVYCDSMHEERTDEQRLCMTFQQVGRRKRSAVYSQSFRRACDRCSRGDECTTNTSNYQ